MNTPLSFFGFYQDHDLPFPTQGIDLHVLNLKLHAPCSALDGDPLPDPDTTPHAELLTRSYMTTYRPTEGWDWATDQMFVATDVTLDSRLS